MVERYTGSVEVSGSNPLRSIRLAPLGLAHGRPSGGEANALSDRRESMGSNFELVTPASTIVSINMNLISHGHGSNLTPPNSAGSSSITLVEQMKKFELGAFLIENRGLNGYWTSYVLLHPNKGRKTGLSSDGSKMSELESWLLNKCPIFLATQQRFQTFRTLTQDLICPGATCASIPCGLMDDLLSLDYSAARDVKLMGIDLDAQSLEHAERNHKSLNPSVAAAFVQADAWSLPPGSQFDLITSNGLNIYVTNDENCVALYASFAKSLKPGGYLVMSFISPPETWTPYDPSDLIAQRELFTQAVPVKWQCTRSEELTRSQLQAAGFKVDSIHYDEQRMFPAVLARKQSS